ncbi:hypothetical protein C0992_010661, partial [Termitomyces sp. T32_za158]
MATTSVTLDYNSPTIQPPPLDPQGYFPHPTPGTDFTQLAGIFDPTAIPPMNSDHAPGTEANSSGSANLTPEFAAILAQLTHNQTMLQNSLVDVMTE